MKNELVAPKSEGVVEEFVNKWGKSLSMERFRLLNGEAHDFFFFNSAAKTVVVFAVTQDRNVITVEQFRYGASAFVKELPGGCEKPGQNPEKTLVSELLEETGYRPKRLVRLGEKMWFEPASSRVHYQPFLALDCVYVKDPTPERDEIMKTVLYPIEAWAQMISDGLIDDDKSIAITWRALAYLGWRFQPPK